MKKFDAHTIIINSVLYDFDEALCDLSETKFFMIMPELEAAIEFCFLGRNKARLNPLRRFLIGLNIAYEYMSNDDKKFVHKLRKRAARFMDIQELEQDD